MTAFPLVPGLWVQLFTAAQAERRDRHSYNVPADVGLGWRPYRVLIQSYGCTAYKAFHTPKEFRRALRAAGLTVILSPGLRGYRGHRMGKIAAGRMAPALLKFPGPKDTPKERRDFLRAHGFEFPNHA